MRLYIILVKNKKIKTQIKLRLQFGFVFLNLTRINDIKSGTHNLT